MRKRTKTLLLITNTKFKSYKPSWENEDYFAKKPRENLFSSFEELAGQTNK